MWKDLSMKDRAALIKMGVANGFRDIKDIQEIYNHKFDKGGDLDNSKITFNEAFDAAYNKGLETFFFNGKEYTTEKETDEKKEARNRRNTRSSTKKDFYKKNTELVERYADKVGEQDEFIGKVAFGSRYRRPDGSTYTHYNYEDMPTVTVSKKEDKKNRIDTPYEAAQATAERNPNWRDTYDMGIGRRQTEQLGLEFLRASRTGAAVLTGGLSELALSSPLIVGNLLAPDSKLLNAYSQAFNASSLGAEFNPIYNTEYGAINQIASEDFKRRNKKNLERAELATNILGSGVTNMANRALLNGVNSAIAVGSGLGAEELRDAGHTGWSNFVNALGSLQYHKGFGINTIRRAKADGTLGKEVYDIYDHKNISSFRDALNPKRFGSALLNSSNIKNTVTIGTDWAANEIIDNLMPEELQERVRPLTGMLLGQAAEKAAHKSSYALNKYLANEVGGLGTVGAAGFDKLLPYFGQQLLDRYGINKLRTAAAVLPSNSNVLVTPHKFESKYPQVNYTGIDNRSEVSSSSRYAPDMEGTMSKDANNKARNEPTNSPIEDHVSEELRPVSQTAGGSLRDKKQGDLLYSDSGKQIGKIVFKGTKRTKHSPVLGLDGGAFGRTYTATDGTVRRIADMPVTVVERNDFVTSTGKKWDIDIPEDATPIGELGIKNGDDLVDVARLDNGDRAGYNGVGCKIALFRTADGEILGRYVDNWYNGIDGKREEYNRMNPGGDQRKMTLESVGRASAQDTEIKQVENAFTKIPPEDSITLGTSGTNGELTIERTAVIDSKGKVVQSKIKEILKNNREQLDLANKGTAVANKVWASAFFVTGNDRVTTISKGMKVKDIRVSLDGKDRENLDQILSSYNIQ